jgi:hypothetical protein
VKSRVLKGLGVSTLALAAALTMAPMAASASTTSTTVVTGGHASPMTIHYIRSFYTPDECYGYGYANYGDPRGWFCKQALTPDTLPWQLWAETSV